MPIDKIMTPNIAANAYAKNLGIGNNVVSGAKDGVKFSDFLETKAQGVISTIKESEKVSAMAIKGEADMVAVVQAATNAELALQSVVALRDRMISAYQDIMRMPI